MIRIESLRVDYGEPVPHGQSPLDELARRESFEIASAALRSLPLQLREALEAIGDLNAHGPTAAELARRDGVSRQAISRRAERARQQLQSSLLARDMDGNLDRPERPCRKSCEGSRYRRQ